MNNVNESVCGQQRFVFPIWLQGAKNSTFKIFEVSVTTLEKFVMFRLFVTFATLFVLIGAQVVRSVCITLYIYHDKYRNYRDRFLSRDHKQFFEIDTETCNYDWQWASLSTKRCFYLLVKNRGGKMFLGKRFFKNFKREYRQKHETCAFVYLFAFLNEISMNIVIRAVKKDLIVN